MAGFVMTGLIVCCAAALAAAVYNRLSGRRFFLDLLDKGRLASRSVSSWDGYWAINRDRSDIIVCLTTLPSRLPSIEVTLKSLLYQSRAPAKIRLHVPSVSKREGVGYDVPKWIRELESVEVVECDRDWGPATKLIPALLDCDADQRLLVVDDDKLYAPDLVKSMDIASRAQPDVAIAASGWLAPPDSIDRPVTLWHTYRGDPPARRKATMVKSAVEVDIVQGHSGYLVQPSFFDLDALVHGYDEAPREAFFQDDIWISGHCKVRKLVLPARRFCFVSWRRVGLYDRTSLESRASSQSIEKHPNNVMLRYLEDRWLVHSESISAPR